MAFQPVIPLSGFVGWSFLQRTLPVQTETFRTNPELTRDVTRAREDFGSITSAEQLVEDRQLLKVALGAFGLENDLNNKAFIQKILEDGTEASDALSNRLADKRYKAFAEAFDFSSLGISNLQLPSFVEEVVEDYQTRSFEIAVGEQNNDMRLAFTFERELSKLGNDDMSEDAKWFTIMGNPPLREVFETALNMPDGFGALDLDQQLEEFKDRLSSRIGSADISTFADPEQRESMVRLYLLQSELASGPAATTPDFAALTLLSGNTNASSGLLQTALLR